MGNDTQVSFAEFGARFVRSVRWAWVPLPLLVGALAYVVLRVGVDDMPTLMRVRDVSEVAALVMTCAAVAVALGRVLVQRRPFPVWLLVLAGLVAFREWHIVPWASTLAYVGVVTLFVAAWLNDEPVGRWVTTPVASTLLIVTLLSYAITRPLDMGILQNIGPDDNAGLAPLPFVEEVVENFGHLGLLVLVAVSGRGRPPVRGHTRAGTGSTPPA